MDSEFRIRKQRIKAKFYTACEAGDVATIKKMYQTGQLVFGDLTHMMWLNSIPKSWLRATRCLVELINDPKEISPLYIRECRSLEMFKLLAELGVDFKDVWYGIMDKVEDRDILDWLLDQDVDINASLNPNYKDVLKGEMDYTCDVLNAAATRGDIVMFDYLVSRGAEPSRSIALHTATKCKDPEKAIAMMTHLIEKYKFDVNADEGCNGLRESEHGTIRTLRNTLWDGPPLKWAIVWSRNASVVELLLKHGANPCGVMFAAMRIMNYHGGGTVAVVNLLLESAADTSEASYGLTLAVSWDDLEAAQLCLRHGADPTEAEKDDAEKSRIRYSPPYNGMSSEMRKLINGWKSKKIEAVVDELT